MQSKSKWFVYIVKCADETLYTGCTTDVERRVAEHNGSHNGSHKGNVGRRGAHYTTARRPVVLVYSETAKNRSDAQKREYEIKQLDRESKLRLISEQTATSNM